MLSDNRKQDGVLTEKTAMKRSIYLRSASCLAALFLSFLASTASAQLVVNGGFESGGFSPGWTFTDPSGFTFVNNDPTLAHSGFDFAFLGASPGPGTLLQTLATTTGQTYQLSFWLASDKSTPTATVDNSFAVLWNGSTVFSQTNVPALGTTNPYMNITIDNLAAAGAISSLEFRYVNNDDFFRLDDVALLAVPEMSATSFILFGFVFLGFVSYRRNRAGRASASE